MANKFPETIKIGSINFKFKTFDDSKDVNQRADRLLWGSIDETLAEIRVSTASDPQYLRLVIWHEIVHGLLDSIEEGDVSHNEKFVERMARAIDLFLQNNNIDWLLALGNDNHE